MCLLHDSGLPLGRLQVLKKDGKQWPMDPAKKIFNVFLPNPNIALRLAVESSSTNAAGSKYLVENVYNEEDSPQIIPNELSIQVLKTN